MSQPIELIPVLDLARGVAVHASGGDRSRYAPVQSRLSPGVPGDPLALARAYAALPGVRRCYVADLDAIAGRPPQVELLARLGSAFGFNGPLLLDAGITTVAAWEEIGIPAAELVVGLETLDSFASLAKLAMRVPVTFSLDLRNDRVLAGPAIVEAGTDEPNAIAGMAIRAGAASLLLLDVGRVGRGNGTNLNLVASLRHSFPEVQLLVGGGVSGPADVDALAGAGCNGVLVATALHQGDLDAVALVR